MHYVFFTSIFRIKVQCRTSRLNIKTKKHNISFWTIRSFLIGVNVDHLTSHRISIPEVLNFSFSFSLPNYLTLLIFSGLLGIFFRSSLTSSLLSDSGESGDSGALSEQV